MKAAIFRGGDIVVDTLPAPVPAAGQALVKVLASASAARSCTPQARQAHVEVSRRNRRPHPDGSRPRRGDGHEFCCELIDYGPRPRRSSRRARGFCACR